MNYTQRVAWGTYAVESGEREVISPHTSPFITMAGHTGSFVHQDSGAFRVGRGQTADLVLVVRHRHAGGGVSRAKWVRVSELDYWAEDIDHLTQRPT